MRRSLLCFLFLLFSSCAKTNPSVDSSGGPKPGGGTPVPADPKVSSLSPTSFGFWGGGLLTITGSGFTANSQVQIGGQNCLNVNYLSSTQLKCTLPAHAPSRLNVSVSGPGTNTATLSRALTYQTFLYIGRQGSAGGVTGFSIDPESGALGAIAGSPFTSGGNVTYGVTLSPSRSFLYAANYNGGGISAFRVNAGNGMLTWIANYPTSANPTALAVDPSEKFLVVSGYGACAKHSVFSIDASSGALTAVAGSPFQDIPCQADSGSVHLSPDGKYVYFANFSSSSVSAFALDHQTGALTKLAGSPYTGNGVAGPDNLILHPSGQFLYVANSSNPGAVSAFAVNVTTGELSPLASYPVGFSAVGGAGIRASDDGLTVYYVGQAGATLAPFLVDATLGSLLALPTLPTDAQPQDVAVDPTGKFVYTANVIAKTTNGYLRESTQGALTPLSPSSNTFGELGGLMVIAK